MEFTEEQVTAAKKCRDTIIAKNIDELKSIYMAGEIVMWDEMKVKKLTIPDVSGQFSLNELEQRRFDASSPKQITFQFGGWNWRDESDNR